MVIILLMLIMPIMLVATLMVIVLVMIVMIVRTVTEIVLPSEPVLFQRSEARDFLALVRRRQLRLSSESLSDPTSYFNGFWGSGFGVGGFVFLDAWCFARDLDATKWAQC